MSTVDVKAYIHSTVNPVLEPMIAALISERPDDPAVWMHQYLAKKCGLSSGPGDASGDNSTELRAEINRLKLYIKELESKSGEAKDDDIHTDSEEDDDEAPAELPTFNHLPKNYMSRQRASVSAEVFGAFNKKLAFTPPVYPKTQDQLARLKKILTNCFMFAALDPKDLESVTLAMQEKILPPNDRIIKQGDAGDCLYVVESGALQCFKKFGNDPTEKMVKRLEVGDVFGELALLYSVPRAASVQSDGECVVWALDRLTFNHIVKDAASRRRALYESVLKKVSILEGLDDYDRSKLIDALKVEHFNPGDFIVRQGDDGEALFILEEGNAYAEKTYEGQAQPKKVFEYKAGDYFGELALLRNEKRAASIVASSKCKCLAIDRRAFKRLLGSIEDIIAKKATEYDAVNQKFNH
eukprot:GDKJ01040390.1.p1 GENE.GDKJ01040390.1~~GDKJ01040390.1.p1  ORF type:complete len:411 (-),score=107.76 GDKJ01040390.1:1812-3044(-)